MKEFKKFQLRDSENQIQESDLECMDMEFTLPPIHQKAHKRFTPKVHKNFYCVMFCWVKPKEYFQKNTKQRILFLIKNKFTMMKQDLYLKTVLTVIAIALTVLVLQNANLIPAAQAKVESKNSFAPMEVKVVDWTATDEVKVNVSRWTSRDKMNVNVEEVGGWYVNSGVLKVQEQ